MSRRHSEGVGERLRGVSALPEAFGERRYRARIRRGKGQEVNLGLFPDRWLAAFAYNVAAEALHGPRRPKNEIPRPHQPDADAVRAITARVRRRLGLEEPTAPRARADRPPDADRLLTMLEVTVVGFWRGQVVEHGGNAGRGLDLAAARLVEAAGLLFWCGSAGHPSPSEALGRLLELRLDRTFRRSDLTREVLDDEEDDAFRVARLLVLPDEFPGGGGFHATIASLYAEILGESLAGPEGSSMRWEIVLGLEPPYTAAKIRAAYRERSKALHPDAGGDPAEFVRLREAYEEARRYCASRGT